MRKMRFLTLLVVVELFFFTTSFKYQGEENAPNDVSTGTQEVQTNQAEVLIKAWGIRTSVDEAELAAKYPGVTMESDELETSKTFMAFENPEKSLFRLDVYDTAGQGVISKDLADNKFDLSDLPTGTYIYKLKGAGNTYAGTFVKN